MRRTSILLALLCALALSPLGCGDDGSPTDSGMTPTDAGADSRPPADTGTRDSGPGDSGPMPCTTGCTFVELVAGHDFTCVRRENGQVLCWGANDAGQLGDNRMRHPGSDCTPEGATDILDCSGPVVVRLPGPAVRISARGGFSVCAIDDMGDQYCWGYDNLPPIVGMGQPEKRYVPEQIPELSNVTDVSDGWGVTCSVAGGELFCEGRNSAGQLGQDDTLERREPIMVPGLTGIVKTEVGIMGGFVCASSATETWCWGSNEHGELGHATPGADACMRVGSMGTYPCLLTPDRAPALDGATAISLGSRHGCALGDGGLVCWGDNATGQLGTGDTTGTTVPVAVTSLTGVAEVGAGSSHTCARLDSGQVWCWGTNDEAQLGDSLLDHGMTCLFGTSMLDCSPSPVQVAGITDATHIGVGLRHSCAIRAGGTEVWCWGWNSTRQLGDGTRDRRESPVQVMGLD